MKKTLLNFLCIVIIGNITFAQNFTLQNIDPDFGDEGNDIASGDLDGDGDMDLVISTYDFNGGTPAQDYIKWYKNDGSGNFSIETIVSSTLQWIDGLTIADIDGQFGNDIVATSANQNKLVYFLSDGSGGFGAEVVVDASIGGPGEVVAGDVNMDGNIDLIATSYSNNRTQWYSGDGAGNFTSETDIENGSTAGPVYVDIADFDGDTDLDVLVGFANSPGAVEIYYNQYIESGTMTVSWIKDTETVDTSNTFIFGATFADVNNDGALDVVVVDFSAGTVEWFNKVKNGTSTSNTISNSTIIGNPGRAFVVDIDNDSYNDVIVTDGGVADDAIIWFKGAMNASPSTTPTLVINNNYIIYDITAEDFDADGDMDIASVGNSSDTVDWYKNDLITLSAEDFSLQNITIYPNPTKDILNFEGFNDTIKISVFDVLGKEVLEQSLNTGETLNVSQLANGLYTVNINNTFASKFIKE